MTLWKTVERNIAKIIGGERVPITGRQRGSSPDILHPYLSVEVKERQTLPAWIHEAMEQAVAASLEKTPIVILHEKGSKYENDLVVMKLSDFRVLVLNAQEEIDRLNEKLVDIYNYYRAQEELS